MAMRKKSKAKSKARSSARRSAPRKAKKTARKAAKKPDAAAALAAFARRIVKVTKEGGDFMALYAVDCESTEASGDTVKGHSGLQEKMKGWEQMQEGAKWTPRSVFTDPRSGTICIEWDALVKLRGGPEVPMPEVAIHQVKNGKIVAERYYYNPMKLAGGAQGQPPQS